MTLHSLHCIFFQPVAALVRLFWGQLIGDLGLGKFPPIRIKAVGIGLTLLWLTTGCNGPSAWVSPPLTSPVALTISQISPAASGSYVVSGTASLPDATQLTVAATRYLRLEADLPTPPIYAILDRQAAILNKGRWEARLNLRQPAVNGQMQETWQSNAVTGRSIPESAVTFLVTVEPPHQPANLQQQVESLSPAAQPLLNRFTTDGEFYMQASQVLTVQPPKIQMPALLSPSWPTSSSGQAPIQAPIQAKVTPTQPGAALPEPSSSQPLNPNALFR